jgi:UDP-N-acetylglucosamine--N-acetylmuramyl-(pentapeptide) pyrophosphoryl-undecaprenol N-acetylglucosamine transferase
MNSEIHSSQRILITCGGTGGHFYPGLSIARELERRDGKALLLLSGKNALKQKHVAEQNGISAEIIPSAPIPRSLFRIPSFVLTLCGGTCKATAIIRDFRPEAVLAMGSFTSLPASVASLFQRIPLFLHDGNAKAGKANIFLSKWAKHMFLSFPTVNSDKIKCPYSCVGLPLRPELLEFKISRENALKAVNEQWATDFSGDKFTLLVFGGSQGAGKINRSIPESLLALPPENIQVIHLTGMEDRAKVEKAYSEALFRKLLIESTENMPLLYSIADFVICRAGGSSVSELAFFGKYSLLIPYPFAAESHQDFNAEYLASQKGAEIIHESAVTPEIIREIISKWLKNSVNYKELGLKNKKLAKPDAAVRILETLKRYI